MVQDSDLVLFVIPSTFIWSSCQKVAPYLREGTVVVNAGKGIKEKSYKLMRVVFAEELQKGADVVLTGPSHAEVSRRILTSVVAESANRGCRSGSAPLSSKFTSMMM